MSDTKKNNMKFIYDILYHFMNEVDEKNSAVYSSNNLDEKCEHLNNQNKNTKRYDEQIDNLINELSNMVLEKLECKIENTLDKKIEDIVENKLDEKSNSDTILSESSNVEYNKSKGTKVNSAISYGLMPLEKAQKIYENYYSIMNPRFKEYMDSLGLGEPEEKSYDFSNYVLMSNIKEILEKKGIKQNRIQELSGIPLSTFRSIINNEKSVSLENAFKISMVMKMPIEELFSYVETEDIQLELELEDYPKKE